MRRWAFLLGVAVLFAGCGVNSGPSAPASLPKAASVQASLAANDPDMDAAIDKAKSTLNTFIDRLEHPKPREVFSIEGQFDAPDGSFERLWVDDVTFAAGAFTGTLRDKPAKIASIQQHGQVTVPRDHVTDWIILTSGKSEGGYTIDVLMERQGAPH